MNENANMNLSTRIVQISLLSVGAIALFGGTLQMILGQPIALFSRGAASAVKKYEAVAKPARAKGGKK